MIEKVLIRTEGVPTNLLSGLDGRDVALWIRDFQFGASLDTVVGFLRLPWRLVVCEAFDDTIIRALEMSEPPDSPMTRKRGFIHVIDTDPSRIELPPQSLPIYLLNGRGASPAGDFDSRLRKITMLEMLRRSGVRQMLVVSGSEPPVPPDFSDLWSSGFRAHVTFVSDFPSASDEIRNWLDSTPGQPSATVIILPTPQAVADTLKNYATTYPDDRRIIRVRDRDGKTVQLDVTNADEPERPVLENYSLLEERDVRAVAPAELGQEDFIAFFQNSESSWRPYAAGVPWWRDTGPRNTLAKWLGKLEALGAEENFIAYISSEPGAGGTTLARALAWEFAKDGYPVLLAKGLPFIPDPLPVRNFIKRVHESMPAEPAERDDPADRQEAHRYEAPWILVFDEIHWRSRESELQYFRNEMEKSGRPICILLVTSTTDSLAVQGGPAFRQVAELTHNISHREALDLGRHLNRFLSLYGKQRTEEQWNRFHKQHTVQYLDGLAAFWVTLSFWMQGQYDLTETIQTWMYRAFEEAPIDTAVRHALLEIAALSSERLPMPEVLLTSTDGQWPVSHLLEDSRTKLASLGLTRVGPSGARYWALVHDILGRFLINAFFYDFALRDALGFGSARDAEHLRFLLLRGISHRPLLGERALRPIGEDFATSIFKIDPDHGHISFSPFWRDVLDALDKMPRALRDTSRVFRHHTAISRRRIAKLDDRIFGVGDDDRLALLTRAVDDINYALTSIEFSIDSESNLNLLNSLANAYFDLAKFWSTKGASREKISELRRLANDATRRAYEENPTSRFVIETYVKNLLQAAAESNEGVVDLCVEALGIVFSALATNEAAYRASQLGAFADEALAILFRHAPPEGAINSNPRTAVELLVNAWTILARGGGRWSETGLSAVPEGDRAAALKALQHPAGRGNMQVLRLSFDLIALTEPSNYKAQLDIVEELQGADYRLTPQLRLEYAILLFQNARSAEGDRVFRGLRQLWRDSEHFVYVPERLRWLRGTDGSGVKVVHAVVGSDHGNRPMARVQEFGNTLVPFRPEEHGFREAKPGTRFSAHVSFGHNGPFLRPVTAVPNRADVR